MRRPFLRARHVRYPRLTAVYGPERTVVSQGLLARTYLCKLAPPVVPSILVSPLVMI